MLIRSLLVWGLVGCMSGFASAEVFVEYWPTGEAPNGVNDKIEADISGGDVNMTLNIGLTAPGGATAMLGADFVFSWPAGFNVTNFQWDAGFDPLAGWFPNNNLPAPSLGSFFPTAAIPVGPSPQLALATVEVTVADTTLPGSYSIDTTPTVKDAGNNPFVLDAGSESISINVTPEPATLVLLVLGGFTALRRRR
ncbi:MAG: PEP-CTERM sorting domain-containing protein [Phycisphaerae bacterium]